MTETTEALFKLYGCNPNDQNILRASSIVLLGVLRDIRSITQANVFPRVIMRLQGILLSLKLRDYSDDTFDELFETFKSKSFPLNLKTDD